MTSSWWEITSQGERARRCEASLVYVHEWELCREGLPVLTETWTLVTKLLCHS